MFKEIIGIQKISPKNKKPFYFLFVKFSMDKDADGSGCCCDRIFVPEDKMLQGLKVSDRVLIGFNTNGYVDFIQKV